ncbi:MAG: PepSY domain-containing protein, partial [Planctomycetaceae bacterium]|nr:PepSY domain-containing protein [Planctomycetaceae bacterium]
TFNFQLTTKKIMSFQFFRRFFYEIHLWLGIISGIIVFLICLSGCILVFREEINRFADPGKYYVSVPAEGQRLPVDEVIAKLEAKNSGMKVTSITIPEKANRTILVSLSRSMPEGMRSGEGSRQRGQRPEGERAERSENKPQQGTEEKTQNNTANSNTVTQKVSEQNRPNTPAQNRSGGSSSAGSSSAGSSGAGSSGAGSGGHGGGRGQMYYINPYTGDVVAKSGDGVLWLNPFFMSMMRLHRNLWISYRLEALGPRASLGGLIVGTATIIFVVIVLSGLVLWLPRTWSSFFKWRAWKPGFKIRIRKGFWSFVYDIHNSLGFYLLIPVLILALTGLCWSFGWYRTAASNLLGDQIFKQRMQRPEKIEPVETGTQPLSVGEIIERQNKLTPGRGEIIVSIPNDRETAMVIQKGRTGFFALSLKDKTQWDRYRGTVIPVEHFGKTVEVERFADKPLGAKIAASVRSLHFGDITGTSSKILFFIACLFATSFPITGVMLWTKKLMARRRKRKAANNKDQNQSLPTVSIDHPLEGDNPPVNISQTV